MDNRFLQIIKKITDNYGIEVFDNLSITKSFLADYSEGAFYKERNLFIWILESNCHKALTANQEIDDWKIKWVKKLHEEDFIDEESVSDMLDLILGTAIVFEYFINKGKYFLNVNDYSEAIINFKHAIDLKENEELLLAPLLYESYFNWGIHCLENNIGKEAVNHFKNA